MVDSKTARTRTRRRGRRRGKPETPSVEKQPQQEPAEAKCEKGFLFADAYWDEAFGSYYDPSLHTCCKVVR